MSIARTHEAARLFTLTRGATALAGALVLVALPFPGAADDGVGCATAEECLAGGVKYYAGNGVTKDLVRANQLYEKACELGNAEGCFDRGVCHELGQGVAKDMARANQLYEKACELGNAAGCFNRGLCYELGNTVAKDMVRANQLYEKACGLGEGRGCTNLGAAYHFGRGVAKDMARANQLYEKGCTLGNGKGCGYLGYTHATGSGVAKDVLRANYLFEKACTLGDGEACKNLGIQYESGNGVGTDLARANQLYDKACGLGDGQGCKNLGYSHEAGRGVAQDVARANQLYEKACGLGEGMGCRLLGNSQRRSVAQDVARANQLYEKACGLGDGMGCHNLAYRYQTGTGAPKDLGRANELYERACRLGAASGCNNLGANHETGSGVPKDLDRANQLYEKACELGNASGCYSIGLNCSQGNGVAKDDRRAAQLFERACGLGGLSGWRGCAGIALSYERGIGVAADPDRAREFRKKACELGDKSSCQEWPVETASAEAKATTVISAGPMARLPGGRYATGSPRRTITIEPFLLDVTAVTVAAFDACVQAGKCSAPNTGGHCNWGRADRVTHPINCVDAHQAMAYCAFAGKRLPTHEEHEWAARGADWGMTYPWGDSPASEQLCWDGGSVQRAKRQLGTCPVGSFPAGDSPEGIKDLTSNVEEWTSTTLPDQRDTRVATGGSWRSAYADVIEAGGNSLRTSVERQDDVGFRCASSATLQPQSASDALQSDERLLARCRAGNDDGCVAAARRGLLTPADRALVASRRAEARARGEEEQRRVDEETEEELAASRAATQQRIVQSIEQAAASVATAVDPQRAVLERRPPATAVAMTAGARPVSQPQRSAPLQAAANEESPVSRARRAQSGLRSCIGHITPTNPVAPVIHWSAAASTFRNSIAKVDACWSAKGRRDTNDSCGRAVHSSDAKQWSRTHDEVRRLTRWADGLSSELKRECGYVFAPEWQVEFWCDNLSRDCLKELNTWLPVFAAWEKAETCLWYGDHRAAQAKTCRDRVGTCEREHGAKLDGPDPCVTLR